MTMPPMPTFSPGDIVIIPFPFTDRDAAKRRPALVCSSATFNRQAQHFVLAMITTSTHTPWPGDVVISDLKSAGLPVASVVRWKLFTLDASFVLKRGGKLSARDRAACRAHQPVAL
ncbi:MAG: type II toxin-antitoxin system PemK/MazF family toxin [Gemmatimonadaceae bacterium]